MRSLRPPQRRLIGASVIAVLVLALVLALALGGDAPPTGAAKVVPADALVYVHVSTDAGRDATRHASALARRFPDYPLLRDRLLRALNLTGRGAGLTFERDLRPWVGKEAALALLNAGSGPPATLAVFDVADRGKAQRFLDGFGSSTAVASYRGSRITTYGHRATAFVSHYVLVGSPAAVTQGIDANAGRRAALAGDAAYARATKDEPAGRFADIYASRAGIRVLASRGGLVGTVATLLDQRALLGTAVTLSAHADGLRVRVHSALDAAQSGQAPPVFAPFAPTLPAQAPATAIALVGLNGLDRALPRLLGATSGVGAGSRLAALLGRAGQGLTAAGVNVPRDVLPLFHDEVALLITPHQPLPTLTLIARTPDEERARTAFAQLQGPIAELFTPSGAGPGQVPTFTDQTVAGVHAFQLRLSPTLELDYAVFGGRLVASTNLSGIAAVSAAGPRLAQSPAFKAALAHRPSQVTALVFLDLSQLLSLGEQIGLDRDPHYGLVRGDLKRVHAVGLSSSSGEADTTAELFFQIP